MDDAELIEREVYGGKVFEYPTNNHRRKIGPTIDVIERCWMRVENGIATLDWRPIPVVDQEGNPCT